MSKNKILFTLFLIFSRICFAPTGDSYTLTTDTITGEYKKREPYVGVFPDLMVASRTDIIGVQFQYNIPPDLVVSTTSNGGTITHDSVTGAMAHLSTSTNTAGLARLASKTPLRYVPGHEAYAYFTAVFTTGVADSTQLAGIFDTEDGFAIGYNGATFSVLHRLDSSDTFISQANFNIDKLDGSGPSRITLDPTKINIYRVAFGWLGTAPIVFEVCRQDGQWFPFHMIQRANNVSVPSLYSPILPLTMEVENNGNSSDLSIKTASWNAGVLGSSGIDRQNQRSVTGTTFSSTGSKMILALRNESSFESKTNRINVHLRRAYFSATAATSFKNAAKLVRFTFYKGDEGMVTDGSWSFHDSSGSNKTSCVKYNSTATAQSGGTEVFMVPFVSRESREIIFDESENQNASTVIKLNPGEELAIEATTSDTTTVTGDVSLVWHETIS